MIAADSQDWVPSMLETTSAVSSTGNTAAWASSTTTVAYLSIVLFLAAAAIGGGPLPPPRSHRAGAAAHTDRYPGPSLSKLLVPERQSIVGLALPQRNVSARWPISSPFRSMAVTPGVLPRTMQRAFKLLLNGPLRSIYWRRVYWRRPRRRQSARSMAIPHVRCPSRLSSLLPDPSHAADSDSSQCYDSERVDDDSGP